jgi:hypothetical protein
LIKKILELENEDRIIEKNKEIEIKERHKNISKKVIKSCIKMIMKDLEDSFEDLENIDKKNKKKNEIKNKIMENFGDYIGMTLLAPQGVQRVVSGELSQFPVTEAVQTTVTAVDPEILPLIIDDSHKCGTHPLHGRVGMSLGGDDLMDGLKPYLHGLIHLTDGKPFGHVRDKEA